MSDIFLSYAREDTERASLLAQTLQQQGHSVWWDRRILSGSSFDKVIKKALDEARCVIVLWSWDSVDSDWVKEEAARGKHRQILVPVLIDQVDIPLGFGRIQTSDLVDWQGDETDPRLQQLFLSVAAILGQKAIEQRPQRARPKRSPKPRKPSTSRRYVFFGCAAIVVLGGVLIAILTVISMIGSNARMPAFSPPEGWQATPPPPPPSDAATIYLRYTGDQFGGCLLSLLWQIGGVSVAPTRNPQPVSGVPLGQASYQVSGTIQCPMIGACSAVGSGSIGVQSQGTYDISWRQLDLTTCSVSLQPTF